jgi:hypothetical protein
MGRGRRSLDEPKELPRPKRADSSRRDALRLPLQRGRHAYGEAIRRTSLLVERVLGA